MKNIYLSPSNYYEKDLNRYEINICREISELLKKKLDYYEYITYICNENSNIDERIKESITLNLDAYICIHIVKKSTNNKGPYIIHGKNYLSKKMSNSILNQLKLIYPYNINNIDIKKNNNILEISNIIVPLCFIEFPESDIKWLIKNKINIANHIAIGIKDYFNNLD